jgi:hypothetical protein
MLARGSSSWGRDAAAAHRGLNPDVELTFVLARKIPLGEVSEGIDHLGGLDLKREATIASVSSIWRQHGLLLMLSRRRELEQRLT